MIPVKICGITSINDAVLASDFGASAIGMIFYEKSPRNINPKDAKNWISQVPSTVKKVGVFVYEELGKVNTIAESLGLGFKPASQFLFDIKYFAFGKVGINKSSEFNMVAPPA